MCATEQVKRMERVVAALGRRVLARQAEYEATHAAWVENRARWSELAEGDLVQQRSTCRSESVRLDARCRALNGRIKQLNRLLWQAETDLAAAQDLVAAESAVFLASHFSAGASAKFSPPGRPACAESGCPKAIVYPSEKSEETGWLTRSTGGNRVGQIKIRNPKSEIRKDEAGRACA